MHALCVLCCVCVRVCVLWVYTSMCIYVLRVHVYACMLCACWFVCVCVFCVCVCVHTIFPVTATIFLKCINT